MQVCLGTMIFGAYSFPSLASFASFFSSGLQKDQPNNGFPISPRVTFLFSAPTPNQPSPDTTVALSRPHFTPGRLPSIATHSGHFLLCGSFGSSELTDTGTDTNNTTHQPRQPHFFFLAGLVGSGGADSHHDPFSHFGIFFATAIACPTQLGYCGSLSPAPVPQTPSVGGVLPFPLLPNSCSGSGAGGGNFDHSTGAGNGAAPHP